MWMSRTARRAAAVFSAIGTLVFVVIVLVEHLADSSLDPATHEISEYVHGPLGALMVAGFIIWGLALAAAAFAVSGCRRGMPVAVALLLAAAGVFVTAGFATQTSAGRLPPSASLSATGRLHDIGSGLATLALVLAVVLSLRLRFSRVLEGTSVLVLAIALIGEVVLLMIGVSVGGVRQRVLLGSACAWQIMLVVLLARRAPRRS
jgi:hypothetical protein